MVLVVFTSRTNCSRHAAFEVAAKGYSKDSESGHGDLQDSGFEEGRSTRRYDALGGDLFGSVMAAVRFQVMPSDLR